MSNKLLYDITNKDRAIESLSKYLNINKDEIFKYILCNVSEEIDYINMYYDLIQYFNINFEELSVENVEIKSIHVTTGNDDGKFIIENGLLNLRNVLINDTPMYKFLINRGIEINIDKRLIRYKDKLIEIQDESKKISAEKSFVYHKLFKDYLINGFHCDEEPIKYGGNVAYRPEFIRSLGILLNYNQLEYEWAKEFNQCYIVEYKANPYRYEWFNYRIDNLTQEEFENDKDKYIKKWLIMQAIMVIAWDMLGWGRPEVFSYFGFNNNVLPSEIISVIDVTKERQMN